jgi:hypothetical protein
VHRILNNLTRDTYYLSTRSQISPTLASQVFILLIEFVESCSLLIADSFETLFVLLTLLMQEVYVVLVIVHDSGLL